MKAGLPGAGVYGRSAGGLQYNFSATQNNGQITQQVYNGVYGTATIANQYDALKRVTSGALTQTGSTGYTPWTETFQYDGFGNLTAKVMNGTSEPQPVNPATNQLSNAYYDANGNMTSGAGATFTYDEANRVTTVTETSGGEAFYGYDAANRRIYQRGTAPGEVFTFFGAHWENLGRYTLTTEYSGGVYSLSLQPQVTNLWFAGRLVMTNSTSQGSWPLYQDRLGTMGLYVPYGEGVAGYDMVQFATYTRDSYSGIDYAQQRFYASSYGRFLTADPYWGSASAASPSSWNRFAYVLGDPINSFDPTGLDEADTCGTDGLGDDCLGGGGGDAGGDDGSDCVGGCVAGPVEEGNSTFTAEGTAPGPASPVPGDAGVNDPGPNDPEPPSPLPGGGGGPSTPTTPSGPGKGGRRRTLDPGGQECMALAKKISNIQQDIAKRESELQVNSLGLGGVGVLSHLLIVAELEANLLRRVAEYEAKCGGGPPAPLLPVQPPETNPSGTRWPTAPIIPKPTPVQIGVGVGAGGIAACFASGWCWIPVIAIP